MKLDTCRKTWIELRTSVERGSKDFPSDIRGFRLSSSKEDAAVAALEWATSCDKVCIAKGVGFKGHRGTTFSYYAVTDETSRMFFWKE